MSKMNRNPFRDDTYRRSDIFFHVPSLTGFIVPNAICEKGGIFSKKRFLKEI